MKSFLYLFTVNGFLLVGYIANALTCNLNTLSFKLSRQKTTLRSSFLTNYNTNLHYTDLFLGCTFPLLPRPTGLREDLDGNSDFTTAGAGITRTKIRIT